MSATIEIATESTDELVQAMAVLIPQLSKSNPPPSATDLNAIIASEASVLFIARVNGKIAGALTLATFRIPTGVRAWIEDVVELTSRPSREAANRLYQRIGFVQRETNIYRYTI